MLVETKQRLEKLQKLLKAEKIQPVSAKRAAELFKKVFTTIQDPVKGLSKFRKKYPKYFKTITQEGARSVEGNKLRAYLEKINKNLTEDLSTSSTELNKKAKTNLKVGTVFNIVKTFNENKQNKFILRGTTGTSDIDPIYANSKKFKEYYDNLENYPKFEEAKSYQKKNAHKAFLRRASSKIDPNFPLTTEEFVNKIGGIKAKTIPSYVVSTGNRRSSIGDYIQENFSYKRRGGAELRWKDPSDTSLRKWNRFLNSRIINKTTVDNVQTLYDDKNIYKAIFEDKRLPQLDEVQKVLKTKSPSIAAYAMSILARKLKGEEFKTDINIPKNTVAGKRILNQIGDLGIRDAYRSAFYSAALSNVDSYYKNQGATSLRQFKTDFNNELKTLLSLGKDQKVPFSVNEVIGISTGEMRGLQPYSAFVDITERNINEKALAAQQDAEDKIFAARTGLAKEELGVELNREERNQVREAKAAEKKFNNKKIELMEKELKLKERELEMDAAAAGIDTKDFVALSKEIDTLLKEPGMIKIDGRNFPKNSQTAALMPQEYRERLGKLKDTTMRSLVQEGNLTNFYSGGGLARITEEINKIYTEGLDAANKQGKLNNIGSTKTTKASSI